MILTLCFPEFFGIPKVTHTCKNAIRTEMLRIETGVNSEFSSQEKFFF